MLNDNGSLSASAAFGVNDQASPTMANVVGLPDIVGAVFAAGGGGGGGETALLTALDPDPPLSKHPPNNIAEKNIAIVFVLSLDSRNIAATSFFSAVKAPFVA